MQHIYVIPPVMGISAQKTPAAVLIGRDVSMSAQPA
jgi:hypothetical protein